MPLCITETAEKLGFFKTKDSSKQGTSYSPDLQGTIAEGVALQQQRYVVIQCPTEHVTHYGHLHRAKILHDMDEDDRTDPRETEKWQKKLTSFKNHHRDWTDKAQDHLFPIIHAAIDASGESHPYLPFDEDNGTVSPPSKGGDSKLADGQGGGDTKRKGTEGAKRVRRKRGRSETESEDGTDRSRRPEQWQALVKIDIVLPSSCVSVVRTQSCMAEAVKIEYNLRVCDASEALETLRTHVITDIQLDKRSGSSQAMETRWKKWKKTKTRQLGRAAATYRRAYSALCVLGYEEKDDDQQLLNFKPLHDSDIRPFATYTEDMALHGKNGKKKRPDMRIGGSKQRPSWIWESMGLSKDKDLLTSIGDYTDEGA